ncbi:hypothetical protein [Streptosporangium sp. NBC_01756]|uniref:hypothetical protein n=1 Tax=Streptosporangium sp. NBC_01756 TaxID=2975950 RepID=UPI002DDC6605|nr:hypothetical protein [Streptosporangium sp. NBC_01756]WSC82995.1 hypothetical protein OIE48_21445 [Streptosporangium sp. NBC_01756]
MWGINSRRGKALRGAGLALLLAAVLAGCGDGDGRSTGPAGSASRAPEGSASPTTEGSASATPTVSRTGLLYRDREISLSDVQAIKNGCPSDIYVEFADSGPRVLGSDESNPRLNDDGEQTEEDRPPILAWSPPCSSANGRFDFDDVAVAKAAADAGDLDEAACRDAARAAVGSGTDIDRYGTQALAVGDRFCEDFAAEGRVVLLRVVKVSGSPVAELTLSATLWAGPARAEGPPAQPGEKVYENQPFTVADDVAKARDCGIGGVGIGSDLPRVRYRHTLSGGGGDVEYFPSCLSGSPKVRFGGYVARVEGGADPDITACQDAAARGERNDLDVPVSELRAGDRFCMFDSFEKYVALLKVTAVTAEAPVSATFSVTRWEAPEPS